jgi:transposase-like protein
MINGMVKMRTEGYTHAQIARRYGVSERTVRRHTKGASPRLVHASDPKRLDLLAWCGANIFAVKDRLKLSVREADVAMKKAREEIANLDPLTRQRLERDPKMRIDFFFTVLWPAATPEIQTMRFVERIERQFGPLNKGEGAPD